MKNWQRKCRFVERIQIWLKSGKNSGPLHEDLSMFCVVSCNIKFL